MCDENKSVSIAVNRKRVRSSGHHGVVSGEMSVMHNVHASGKLGVCSKRASQDKTSWGACEHACRGDEVRRCGLGSDGGLEERPEVGGKAQGDWTGSAEHVCDSFEANTYVTTECMEHCCSQCPAAVFHLPWSNVGRVTGKAVVHVLGCPEQGVRPSSHPQMPSRAEHSTG
jgi:hypothetical protein